MNIIERRASIPLGVWALLGLESLALAAFFFSGWRADGAMDSAGFGDYQVFALWTARADAALLVFGAAWILAAAGLVARYRRRLLRVTVGAPAGLALWAPLAAGAILWLVELMLPH